MWGPGTDVVWQRNPNHERLDRKLRSFPGQGLIRDIRCRRVSAEPELPASASFSSMILAVPAAESWAR